MEQCLSNIPKWIKRRKPGKKGGIRVRLRRRKCKHSGREDSPVDIEGFKLICGDRNNASGKQRGGGVCACINNKWCNNITVKYCACSKDIEIISV